jgi:hypothetical protein
LAEEEIAHGRIADDDHFVDGLRIGGKFFDGVAEVAGEGAHEQTAGMVGVVGDARHDFRAAEALRVFEGGVGDELAGFKVDKAQDDRGGAEIHRDAEQGAGGAGYFNAVNEDAITVAGDGGIGFEVAIRDGQSEGVALDAHVTAAHGMAADVAFSSGDMSLTGQAKVTLEVALWFGER